MRSVLGVSVGSAIARGVALDTSDESVRSAHVVRSFDPDDHLQVALDLLDSMSRDQMVDRPDIVLAVPDDPGARGRTSAYSTYEADRLLVASELGAQLRYLRGTGMLEGARTVAVCDIGASGTTVSIADPATGAVHSSVRTTLFGGIGCDAQISRYLLSVYGADELASERGCWCPFARHANSCHACGWPRSPGRSSAGRSACGATRSTMFSSAVSDHWKIGWPASSSTHPTP